MDGSSNNLDKIRATGCRTPKFELEYVRKCFCHNMRLYPCMMPDLSTGPPECVAGQLIALLQFQERKNIRYDVHISLCLML
jgi:hypothetical protein